MAEIEKIDTNFKVETNLNKPDIKFYDVKQAPIKLYGVFYENGKFRRMPENVAKQVSDGVYSLHANTAGGRVRFKTNSPYIAISANLENIGRMPHFAFSGSSGFDLYEKKGGEKYLGTFMPPYDMDDGYEAIIELGNTKMKDITINFPLYSDVNELYIGISKDSTISEPTPYKVETPIVFYGSSITQGGCASRPGNAYQSLISQALNVNFINLGFSGNAKAETEMGDYIKNLNMSMLVLDYDHNAPTLEHLKDTHERIFKQIRSTQPNLPIILMPRPKWFLTKEESERRKVILQTYKNAKANKDKNVYFIDSTELLKECKNNGTVDMCHPNDWGFYSMSRPLIKLIKKLISNKTVHNTSKETMI